MGFKNEYPIFRPARRDPADAGNIQQMNERQNTKDRSEYPISNKEYPTDE